MTDSSLKRASVQAKIIAILKDLKPFDGNQTNSSIKSEVYAHKPGLDKIPVPDLVLFALRDFLGLEECGPFEKVRWVVTGLYKGRPVSFERRKLGFTIVCPQELYDEILLKIISATRVSTEYLSSYAENQARQGNVTIKNELQSLEECYRFFREKAQSSYQEPQAKPEKILSKEGEVVGTRWDLNKPEREGSYYAGAMLNAYFSKFEHLMVLCAPFSGFNPDSQSVTDLIGMHWGKKFKAILKPQTCIEAKRFYDRLDSVKEELRNTQSHGGFEKGWGSMYFHLPDIGAIPAKLVAHKYEFVPITSIKFDDVCKLFDEFDSFLSTGPIRYGYKYAMSGLNISFDKESISSYGLAMQSDDKFDAFIEREAHLEDYHTNMEY